ERVNHPRTVSCPQITAPAIPLPSTRALPSIGAPAPVPVGTVVPVEQVGHDPGVGEGTWMKSFTFGGAAPLPFQKGRSAPSGGDPNAPEATQEPLGGSDRKSTRLNSSHVSNSYAVFCLKNKTTLA